jgi:flagellar hook protein FlgE
MGNIGSLLNTGVAGIQKGLGDANRAAADIAKIGTRSASGEGATSDLTRAVVDLKSSELQVKASAQVVKTADDMLGSLIDTLA